MCYISRCKLAICALVVCLALFTRATTAHADTSINKNCDAVQGFAFDPVNHHNFGHITQLNIGDTNIAPDTTVFLSSAGQNSALPFPGLTSPASGGSAFRTACVVGVIEKFSWDGGVGDPLKLEFYVSTANAAQLKSLSQSTLKTTGVKSLAWWIAEYDLEGKNWFEAVSPINDASLYGVLNNPSANSSGIKIASKPITDMWGIQRYAVELTLAPPTAPKQQQLLIRTSTSMKWLQSWGFIQN